MSNLIFTLVPMVWVAAPVPEPKLPVAVDLDLIRALPVQHDGRWPPLDTVARDCVESVTGDTFFQGHDPVAMLLAWTFDAQTWARVPLIPIRNAELRRELQLSATRTVFSYSDLIGHQHLQSLIGDLARIERGRKMNPLESKVNGIHEKLVQLEQVFMGRAIKPIPNAEDMLGAWSPIRRTEGTESEQADPIAKAWTDLRTAFLADDGPAFAAAADRLTGALGALPASHRPDPKTIATELRYNKLRPFRSAWQVMVLGAVLAAAAMVVRRKWFDAVAVTGMVVGFVLLTYGLSMRWQIAGRIPAANMFESLLFLSWGMGAFAIGSMIFLRHRIVPLTASAMGAFALVLADCLPLDHFVRPIPPVLMDTVWMSIHVPVIMVSYSVLALAVLFAHVQVVIMAAVPKRRPLIKTIDSLHYWYVHVGSILLLAGIVTGSMWAASSWGRYWGWDPKEVWSLVAFLGYLAILHVRINHERTPRWAYAIGGLLAVALFALVVPKLAPITGVKVLALTATGAAMVLFVMARGELAAAMKSILAFWLIIMTYVGVNYVLGIGLHSYGFGTGAVVRYMFLTGGTDLALVAVCCAIYLARRGARRSPAIGLPVANPA